MGEYAYSPWYGDWFVLYILYFIHTSFCYPPNIYCTRRDPRLLLGVGLRRAETAGEGKGRISSPGVDGVLVLHPGFIVVEKHTIASAKCVFPIDGHLMTDPENVAWVNRPGKAHVYAIFSFIDLNGGLRDLSDMSYDGVTAYTAAFRRALGGPMDYFK